MLVDFYHLDKAPLERVLPSICEKIIASGERLLIVAGEGDLTRLDKLLWTYTPESFLPHGRRERPGSDAQPILLAEAPEPLNGAANIALADGQWRDDALRFARAFFFFSAAELAGARTAWRALKGREGVESRYWKQDDRGKWVQGP